MPACTSCGQHPQLELRQAGHVLAHYGASSRDYVWLDDLPAAMLDNASSGSVTSSTINYVVADQLNTPRAVNNSAGSVIWSWAYQGNPFGEQQPVSATGYVLNLRYPGQYYDVETGTAYNVNRNYESATGRYLQSDPTGLDGGISTYAYVGNNPLIYVDPYGLAHCVGTAICDFTPEMNQALKCLNTCTGRDLAITSGRGNRNTPNSSHSRGEACDLGRGANPGLLPDTVRQCRAQCLPQGYGQEEQNIGSGTHDHLQLHTVPGG